MVIIPTDKPLRPRDPHDFYPTPIETVTAALNTLPIAFKPVAILDPGAGSGIWGRVARENWPNAGIIGVELRDIETPDWYDEWHHADFRMMDVEGRYSLVMGNPPYKHAEAFIRHAWKFLGNGGRMVFLLRLAFLEGQARRQGLWREMPPSMVYVCSSRPSFTGNGKTDATAYAVFSWLKGWQGTTMLGWL